MAENISSDEDRIVAMEARMDKCTALTVKLACALAEVKKFLPEYEKFAEYYGSAEWFADRAAVDSGTITGVKCGVLSEDLPFDAVTEWRDAGLEAVETGVAMIK